MHNLVQTVALLMDKLDTIQKEREGERMFLMEQHSKQQQDARFTQMLCNDHQTKIVALNDKVDRHVNQSLSHLNHEVTGIQSQLFEFQ